MLWRKARRIGSTAPLEKTESFIRATNFDKNDLHSANLEFEDEIKKLERWIKSKGPHFKAEVQKEGFNNEYDRELEEIAVWWHSPPPLNEATLKFFDEYVHDSRAWFKLDEKYPDSETALQKELVIWEKKRKRAIQLANQPPYDRAEYAVSPDQLDGLTDDQRRAAQEYARTGKTPRLVTTGRESDTLYGFALYGGYLRFRKIYGGADGTLLSQNMAPDATRYAVHTDKRTDAEEV